MELDLSWTQWTKEEIDAATQAALTTKGHALDGILALPVAERTFNNTIAALEHAGDGLADVAQQLQLLMSVHPSSEIRDAAQLANDRIEAAVVEMDYDPRIWRAVSDLDIDIQLLEPIDAKLYSDTMRDLRRMGFELPPEKFNRLKQARQELQKLESEFEKTINDYEDFISVSREDLDGLSERYIDGLKKLPDGTYKVSLEYPDLFPFMQYAKSNDRRAELGHKQLLRGGKANMERLAQMIRLRQEVAGLLGYRTHGDFVEEVRMSGSSAVVQNFLKDILSKLKSAAHQELRDLVDIKKRELQLEHPAPVHFYETAYWSQQLRLEKYQLNNKEVEEYFPLHRVLSGMLDIYQSILGLTFQAIPEAVLWHPDAKLYAVTDTKTHESFGHFILDLHPRSGKYAHAATIPATLGRNNPDGHQAHGIVALVCNFPKLTPENPSLLSHDEVETFFHEFGHVMHALLSAGAYQSQNGFYVPLDFVEALSQIFEYWVWDEKVLSRISGHYQTGEVLPKELLDKMLAARRHQEARYFTSQAMHSLYDLEMHNQPTDAPVHAEQLGKLHRDMTLEYMHIDLPDDTIYAAGWGHMNDYDAGVYGYLWSRVYAADMFTRFESKPLDPAIGNDYRSKVLEPGASKKEYLLVEDFLGRPSTNDAFLKEIGIQ